MEESVRGVIRLDVDEFSRRADTAKCVREKLSKEVEIGDYRWKLRILPSKKVSFQNGYSYKIHYQLRCNGPRFGKYGKVSSNCFAGGLLKIVHPDDVGRSITWRIHRNVYSKEYNRFCDKFEIEVSDLSDYMRNDSVRFEAQVDIYPLERGAKYLGGTWLRFETRDKIKEIFGDSADISTQTLTASLNCPISKRRMKVPCISRDCKHIQPFDGEVFLKMNKDKQDWFCPICNIKVLVHRLEKDTYFMEIIRDCPSAEVEKIVFDKEGDWKPMLDHQVQVQDLSVVEVDDTDAQEERIAEVEEIVFDKEGDWKPLLDHQIQVHDFSAADNTDAQEESRIADVEGNKSGESSECHKEDESGDKIDEEDVTILKDNFALDLDDITEIDITDEVVNNRKRKSLDESSESVTKKRNVEATDEISACLIKSSDAKVSLDKSDYYAIHDDLMNVYVFGEYTFKFDLKCLQVDQQFIKLYCKESFNLLKENIENIPAPAEKIGREDYSYEIIPLKYYKVKIPIRIFKEAGVLELFIKRFNQDLDSKKHIKVVNGCVDREREDINGFYFPVLEMDANLDVKDEIKLGSEDCEVTEIHHSE